MIERSMAASLSVVKFATPRVPIACLSPHGSPRCNDTRERKRDSGFSLRVVPTNVANRRASIHCIPHARFARLSLARLSLINLSERAIVRSIAGHPIGWLRRIQYTGSTGSYTAIKGEQPWCPALNWFCVFFALAVLCPLPRLLKPTMICALPPFSLSRGDTPLRNARARSLDFARHCRRC